MVQLKIFFDTRRKKSDGTYPLLFRVTNVKQVNYISSGVSVLQNDWDEGTLKVKKSHPNFKALNLLLSKKYYEIQKAILSLENEGSYTFDNLKATLFPIQKEEPVKANFKTYTDRLITQMFELNKTGNAIVYRTAVNRFLEFAGNEIEFKQIDFNLLEAYQYQLQMAGIKPNSISNYFRTLRAIYNKAIKAKLVGRESYPFYDISVKTEKTAKRAIHIEDIIKICELNLENHTGKRNARNYFLLSFSLIGISFTDLAYLQPTNLRNDRVEYKRRKTHKDYSIKLTNLSKRILNLYANDASVYSTRKYILPILPNDIKEGSPRCKKLIGQWIKTTNKWLKVLGKECKIKEPLTTYVSRHTWASTARRLGYSNEVIAQALGHEVGNRITNIYLDYYDSYVIDEVNDKVLKQLIPIFS